jgi:hypothetical protein
MLKSNLTCSYCSKILQNHIELPCKDSICKEHLVEKQVQKQNEITCKNAKMSLRLKAKNSHLIT